MKSATNTFVSTFGAIMALAGLEHGIGEVLQGPGVPKGLIIESWPGSPFFRILGGEPALTVIPNLRLTGLLAILFSLALLVWSLFFVQRKHGGLVMALLSIPMLLAGAGLFPPVLNLLVSMAAAKIGAPFTWSRARLPGGLLRLLSRLWPVARPACIAGWLMMIPGIPALNYFFGIDNETLTLSVLLFTLGNLLLAALSAFAWDITHRPGGAGSRPSQEVISREPSNRRSPSPG